MAINNGQRAFTAGEALAGNRLVKIKAATTTTPPEVVYADSDEAFIGSTMYDCESGDITTVRLYNVPGTVELEAGEAFAVNAALYVANDGKVVDTDPGTGTIRLKSIAAADASGNIVECLIL